jgi:hypothetical protein
MLVAIEFVCIFLIFKYKMQVNNIIIVAVCTILSKIIPFSDNFV